MTIHTAASSRPLFANRNFILLLVAYGISAFGDHLSEFALLKMQNALDPSVTDVTRRQAIMLFVFMFPFFAFGPICGWIADRLPRRAIMIAADLVRAVVMFEMLALLTGIHQWATPADPGGPISIWVAAIPLVICGLFAAMFSPARLSLLPSVIGQDQLIRANASTAGLGMIASIASAVVGGWMVTNIGVRANFQIDALTFVLSAACLFLVRPPRQITRSDEGGVAQLTAAFRYVREHRRVLEVILISTLLWTAASVVRSIIPALVKDVFGGSYNDIGIYQGILGLGLLLGSLALTLMGPALKSEVAISWSLMLAGLSGLLLTVAVAVKGNQWIAAAGIGLIGFFGAGIQVSVNAFLQRIVPDYIRGRIFGVNDLASIAGLLAATGLLGIPAWPNIDRHITWIMGLTAILLFVGGIWVTRIRLHRGRFGASLTFWRNVNEFYCRLVARLRREGGCTIPATGPAIVAANHNSVLDPFILSACSPIRSVGFMIAREYARLPLVRWAVEATECVPVNRSGNDTASIKAVLRHLEHGKAIGIFPTGKITPRDEVPEAREGIAMLALRSGAKVIPAYIDGLRPPIQWGRSRVRDLISMAIPFFLWHRAVVRFGPPIDLSPWAGREKDRDAYREVADLIMKRILDLRGKDN
ncbi:MAG: MFS transporter [Planctomycetes bacterium]|nr:MFS transporter [Planctomycetota bacterium]